MEGLFNPIPSNKLDYPDNDFSSLTDISGFANWDLSNTESIAVLFNGCKSLSNISVLQNWNVSNVKEMGGVFGGCASIHDLSSLSN